MAKAQEQYKQPSTLEAALEVIDQMQKTIAALEEQVEDLEDSSSFCEECSKLEDQLDEAEDRADALDRYIDDLVSVRHAIKRGTVTDDHLYSLETMLSHLDSGWMCRA